MSEEGSVHSRRRLSLGFGEGTRGSRHEKDRQVEGVVVAGPWAGSGALQNDEIPKSQSHRLPCQGFAKMLLTTRRR